MDKYRLLGTWTGDPERKKEKKKKRKKREKKKKETKEKGVTSPPYLLFYSLSLSKLSPINKNFYCVVVVYLFILNSTVLSIL